MTQLDKAIRYYKDKGSVNSLLGDGYESERTKVVADYLEEFKALLEVAEKLTVFRQGTGMHQKAVEEFEQIKRRVGEL